jgi:ATP-dependent RNA/DNA helicase IGHMBP2
MLHFRGVLEGGNLSVCVLTFYNAQVKCIKSVMKGLTGVSVMTVDSFQGSEADIVLISFVRANSKNRVGFLQDFQRLNVALTRAKRLLVLFGSGNTLKNSGFTFLEELVDDAKLRKKFHNFSEI